MKKNASHHQDTLLATLGRDGWGDFPCVNPPVFRASTLLFPDLATLQAVEAGTSSYPSYGRYGSPTTWALERTLSELQGADHTIAVASGVAAIALALLPFLSQGDHLLMADSVYGPARKFCDYELKRFGIETTYYDPAIQDIAPLIKPNTKVLYLESPGSLTFEMQDFDALVKTAKKHKLVVIADTTWATPLYFRPFEHGIDVALQSATKYVGGHADVLMGIVSFMDAHRAPITRVWRHTGSGSSGDEAYLALRGLRSLSARLKQHQDSALKVANWVKQRPEVVRMLCPFLPEDRGHALWKKYFTGFNGLFAFQIKPVAQEKLAAFTDGLQLFKMGFSWGGFESLIVPFSPAAIRTVTPWKKDDQCIRLHIGLEHPDDLIRDLDAAFARMQ